MVLNPMTNHYYASETELLFNFFAVIFHFSSLFMANLFCPLYQIVCYCTNLSTLYESKLESYSFDSINQATNQSKHKNNTTHLFTRCSLHSSNRKSRYISLGLESPAIHQILAQARALGLQQFSLSLSLRIDVKRKKRS